MAENDSTPSNEVQETDTPEIAVNETSSTVDNEPETTITEPDQSTSEAEQGSENQQEQLIFGKYKSIEEAEKGYKEAEKSFSRAAELEKQLRAYQTKEEQAREQREIEAREQGFTNAEEQEVRYNIANHEFNRYCEALAALSGDNYNNAYKALTAYQQTGNPQYLETAQSYFPAAVISKISGDVALYSKDAFNKYQDMAKKRQLSEIKQMVASFAEQNDEWLNSKERQDIIGLAVKVTSGNIDLSELKSMIDSLENNAVSAYQKKQAESKENQEVQNSLQTPGDVSMSQSGKKWLTREEYNNLTSEQEKANYDLITEQIELENQGKLPRMLT